MDKKNRRYNMGTFSIIMIAIFVMSSVGIENIPTPILIILAIGCIIISLIGLYKLKTNIRIKIYGFLIILFTILDLTICILYNRTSILHISKYLYLAITIGLFCSVLILLIVSIIDNKIHN